jgi:peptidoglycan/xylan/chitin deacetylase (PgdA/CDA1 family)
MGTAAALKSLALSLTKVSGVQLCLRWLLRRRLLVLCYHGVLAKSQQGRLYRNTVGADEFDQQMADLVRYFKPVTATEVLQSITGEGELPERAVLVTFDDGYRNNLEVAAPILERHGVPALFSVTTDYIGTDAILWPTEVELRVLHWPRATLPLPDGSVVDLPTVEGRVPLSERVRRACKALPNGERREYMATLRGENLPSAVTQDGELLAFLDWDEVRELDRRGFAIASHTVTHPILSRVEAGELDAELAGSKARIEQELGQECPFFVYPNGGAEDVTAQVVEAVRRAGYQVAFTLREQVNSKTPPPFEFDRVGIAGQAPVSVFHSRVSHLYSLLKGPRRA